jgi:DNA-binding response OmpR family regulator
MNLEVERLMWGRRVLIVDDELSILKRYSCSLVAAGFEVGQASSGR